MSEKSKTNTHPERRVTNIPTGDNIEKAQNSMPRFQAPPPPPPKKK